MGRIRVVVADDHSLLREGIANLLRETDRVEVIGEASDGVEAVDLVRRLSPDVVLMDLKMPRQDGVAATRIIAQEYPRTRVVVLTVSESDDDLLAAVLAGAKGYLLKNAKISDVVRAIEAAVADEVMLSTLIAAMVVRQVRELHANRSARREVDNPAVPGHPQRTAKTLGKGASEKEIAAALEAAESALPGRVQKANALTRREIQVLRLLVEGASTKAVAERLCISHATARHHIDNIMGKLGVHSRLEAVAYALRAHLTDDHPSDYFFR